MCNKTMVDLDCIEDEDEQLLRELINKHYEYTNSTVAKFVLNDFENQLKNFVKVFPKDYKMVLKQKATVSKVIELKKEEDLISKRKILPGR